MEKKVISKVTNGQQTKELGNTATERTPSLLDNITSNLPNFTINEGRIDSGTINVAKITSESINRAFKNPNQ